MRQTLYSLIIGLILILTGLVALPTAGAQDVPGSQPGLDYETVPGSTTDTDSTNPGVGGTTTTTDDTSGNNLWWLLPLLALPVLYFVFREADDDNRGRSFDTGGYAIGAKGGRSRKSTRDVVTEEEVL